VPARQPPRPRIGAVTHPIRRDVVRRDPDDVLVALVLRAVEREARLAREHGHELLLRLEAPRQLLRRVRVEVDLDAPRAVDGDEPRGLEAPRAHHRRPREARRGAERAVERHGGVRHADARDDL
jgi:hypothetical protein